MPLQTEKQAVPLLSWVQQSICKLETSPSTQPVRKVHQKKKGNIKKENTQTATFQSHEIEPGKGLLR